MKSLLALCQSVFSTKRKADAIEKRLGSSELQKSLERNDLREVFSRVYEEIKSIRLDDAWEIVSPFSLLMMNVELKKCALFLDGLPVVDSGLYSLENLTCSRAKTLSAFKAYAVMAPDDETFLATCSALRRVARVIPDGHKEPLQFDDFDALNLKMEELRKTIESEIPVLKFIRGGLL